MCTAPPFNEIDVNNIINVDQKTKENVNFFDTFFFERWLNLFRIFSATSSIFLQIVRDQGFHMSKVWSDSVE